MNPRTGQCTHTAAGDKPPPYENVRSVLHTSRPPRRRRGTSPRPTVAAATHARPGHPPPPTAAATHARRERSPCPAAAVTTHARRNEPPSSQVRHHHDRVLTLVGVVVGPDTHLPVPELVIERDGGGVRAPDLQRGEHR